VLFYGAQTSGRAGVILDSSVWFASAPANRLARRDGGTTRPVPRLGFEILDVFVFNHPQKTLPDAPQFGWCCVPCRSALEAFPRWHYVREEMAQAPLLICGDGDGIPCPRQSLAIGNQRPDLAVTPAAIDAARTASGRNKYREGSCRRPSLSPGHRLAAGSGRLGDRFEGQGFIFLDRRRRA
jgi:hypothetical protein